MKYEDAALVIQKYFRGVLGRREARRRRVEEENKRVGYASVIIQTWWRGLMARKERMRRMKAISVLQAGMRKMLAKRKHEKEVAAELLLQGPWRRVLSDRRAKEEHRVRERASVRISSEHTGLPNSRFSESQEKASFELRNASKKVIDFKKKSGN